MPSYSIRVDQYAGGPDSDWLVFTINEAGYRHSFLENATKQEAQALASDLGKLSQETIAFLVRDKSGSGTAEYYL